MSDAAKHASHRTFHLARRNEWEAQRHTSGYRPAAFATDGFVHCTDGLDRLLTPANAYFATEAGPFVALEIDLALVSAETRYDAEPPIYPHIYGPVEPSAVVATFVAERDPDGTFTAFRAEPSGG
jgi:uncharacterized protein (DUF952 family)